MKYSIITFLLFSFLFSCKKQSDCPRYFRIPIEIKPKLLEYKIGDTITLLSKFQKEVTGLNWGDKDVGQFNMEGIRWKPVTVINRLDTLDNIEYPKSSLANTKYSDISNYFDIIIEDKYDYNIYNYSNTSNSLNGEYSYYLDTFYLEIKIIPKTTGEFILQQTNDVFAGVIDQQDFPGKCRGTGFDVFTTMNKGESNNIDLLKESIHPHWNTWTLDKPENRFYANGSYCFKVVE